MSLTRIEQAIYLTKLRGSSPVDTRGCWTLSFSMKSPSTSRRQFSLNFIWIRFFAIKFQLKYISSYDVVISALGCSSEFNHWDRKLFLNLFIYNCSSPNYLEKVTDMKFVTYVTDVLIGRPSVTYEKISYFIGLLLNI